MGYGYKVRLSISRSMSIIRLLLYAVNQFSGRDYTALMEPTALIFPISPPSLILFVLLLSQQVILQFFKSLDVLYCLIYREDVCIFLSHVPKKHVVGLF
jgi:hypothetical protein